MNHREHEIQKACVKWFRYRYPQYSKLLFAVPNGGNRNPREAARLKAEGVLAGVSDLILLVASWKYDVLCIEVKTESGKQTKSQKEFQKAVEMNTSKYIVVRSVDEFIREINDYLD